MKGSGCHFHKGQPIEGIKKKKKNLQRNRIPRCLVINSLPWKAFRNPIHGVSKKFLVTHIYCHLSSWLFVGISFSDLNPEVVRQSRELEDDLAWLPLLLSQSSCIWWMTHPSSHPLEEIKCRLRALSIFHNNRCIFRTLFLFQKWTSDPIQVHKSADKMYYYCSPWHYPLRHGFFLQMMWRISLGFRYTLSFTGRHFCTLISKIFFQKVNEGTIVLDLLWFDRWGSASYSVPQKWVVSWPSAVFLSPAGVSVKISPGRIWPL